VLLGRQLEAKRQAGGSKGTNWEIDVETPSVYQLSSGSVVGSGTDLPPRHGISERATSKRSHNGGYAKHSAKHACPSQSPVPIAGDG
jgi:hypothetical protein